VDDIRTLGTTVVAGGDAIFEGGVFVWSGALAGVTVDVFFPRERRGVTSAVTRRQSSSS